MKERDFSARARRTTRVMIRVPVRITTEGTLIGNPGVFTAWTVVVNKHGARLACDRPFQMDEEVLVTVRGTGKSANGKVVWTKLSPDIGGNFEFAVQFHNPTNLWGVEFPPQDWEKKATIEQSESHPIPEASTFSGNPTSDSVAALIPEVGIDTAPESRKEGTVSPPHMDLAPELSSPLPVPSNGFSAEESSDESHPCDPPSRPVSASSQPRTLLESSEPASPSPGHPEAAIVAAAPGPADSPYNAPLGLASVPASLQGGPEALQEGQQTLTDKLTGALRELVESALQAKLEAESKRLVQDIKAQLAEAEEAATANLATQANSLVSSQKASLEGYATVLLAHNRKAAEEQLRQIAEAGEQSSKRVRQETAAITSASLEILRKEIPHELAAMGDQFLQQCRLRTEQLLSTALENASRDFSGHIEGMGKELESLAERVKMTLIHATDQLEQHSAKVLAESTTRIEEEMTKSARVIFGNFAKQTTKGLSEMEKDILERIQQKIAASAEQSVLEARSGLARYLREFSEAMETKGEFEKSAGAGPAKEPARREAVSASLSLLDSTINPSDELILRSPASS